MVNYLRSIILSIEKAETIFLLIHEKTGSQESIGLQSFATNRLPIDKIIDLKTGFKGISYNGINDGKHCRK